MTMPQAYPLVWPENLPRHKGVREPGRFSTTLSAALGNAKRSVSLFGKDSGIPIRESEIVFSSNVGGLEPKVTDPGVALWFTWDGAQRCIAVDRYSTVAANLQAIHHILEADRTKLRHGSLEIVRASFKGFIALPAPKGQSWREILGFPSDTIPTRDEIDQKYRRLAQRAHPDAGGSGDEMSALNLARQTALREVTS